VIARLDPQIVILGGRWIQAEIPAGVADIATGVGETVRQVVTRTRSVCVVLGVPQLKYRAPYALVMARRRHIADDFLTVSRADALAQYRDMEREVRAIAQRSRFKLVDPKDALCPGKSCLYKAHGHSLYYDADHLSAEGALYVAPALEPCFEPDRGQ
jgi:hypothetical protein